MDILNDSDVSKAQKHSHLIKNITKYSPHLSNNHFKHQKWTKFSFDIKIFHSSKINNRYGWAINKQFFR